jgi:LuxR family maltose regulon positive regulatory protein
METALAHIQQAEKYANMPEVIWSWLYVPVDAYLVRLWLGQGEIELAGQWAETLTRADGGPPLPGYWAEGQALALVHHHMARQEYSGALSRLEGLAQEAEKTDRTGSLVEILVLQAAALHHTNRTQEALTTLSHALQLAEPGGYVRLFIDEGPTMRELLRQMPDSPYRRLLLGHFSSATTPDTRGVSPQPLVEPLTDRELEILRLMAARFSNREIGEALYLATTTIKWYSRQIYGKLGVNDRRTAVERARELGIL